ncbi:adhesion G-protein coupled receptor D1-like [Ruditapes philippinarum]|uniref:adhesion G-protein coupled receptor D1-like n=1 Tax=Ruditapes philippinarum TaxID=129788 RepID=UPI00295BF635|nr:adhesion G-protein coupled receptor D1-like [Ruditapes philippinarum]
MAFYAFLMQLHNDTKLSIDDLDHMTLISEVGGAMSMVCCVLILSLLCLLPIRSDGMFITSNMCVVLIAAQISFIGSENTGYPEPYMCKIATCVIHYFFMCVHFSSFAHALHLWSKFAPMCVETCRRRGVYVFTIWIVPALVVIATAMFSGDLYASEERCWLPSERNTRMAFLFPVFLIQVANWVLFVMILRAGIMLDMTKGKDKRTILRHICLSSLSMFPVFGLQWTLGYAVTFNLPIAFQFAFVVLASGQGLLLLVCHILTNSQIQKALCTKIAEKASITSSPSNSASAPNTVDSHVQTSVVSKN